MAVATSLAVSYTEGDTCPMASAANSANRSSAACFTESVQGGIERIYVPECYELALA
ncbi:hypothetical protein GCM10010429_21040 [Micromonospora olivasterospora]